MRKRRIQKDFGRERLAAAVRITLAICAALGWWGVLYPELTMTPDTYAAADVREAEWEFDSGIYYRLLNAQEGELSFKSRILEELRRSVLLKQ